MEDAIFALVSDLTDAQEEQTVRQLCRATEAALRARLRSGVTPEDCADSFVFAAARYVRAALLEESAAVGSFTAGDLSISAGTAGTAQLRQQADLLLAPYLQDGVAFLGVRG
jgi:hypothetical protein